MLRLPRFPGLATLMLALPALAADSLQVKTGLWETTATTAMSGMSIPPEQLAKMPPDQRARMEQMLKQLSGAKPIKSKSCVTAKDLQEGAFRNPSDQGGHCTYKQVSGTARHQEWTFQCTNEGGNATGKMTLDSPDSTHVQSVVDVKSTRGSVNIKLAAQWIAATCTGAEKD